MIGNWLRSLMRRTTPQEIRTDRIIYVPATKAGVRITHDDALTVSGFWAGVRAISDPISYLSWHVFERSNEGKQRRENNYIDWLLNSQPNMEMSAGTFREVLLSHAVVWGNGYAEIERDGAGRPIGLWPLPPDRVCVERDDDGVLFYLYYTRTGEPVPIPARDVFHLRGLSFDGLVGYSVVKLAAQSLGLAKAMEENAATFFGNGSKPGGVLKYPGKVSEETRETTRREWMRLHGGPGKAHTVAVLDQGLDYAPLAMSNDDAQMIESRKMSVTEMARWLRVPPHKLYDLERATFSNIEHMSIEFVTDALMPWINRLEQEANVKLFGYGSQGRLFTKLNVKTLLRGDTAAQSALIQQMLDRGVFSINDAREYLDMNTIGPDGDKRFVPLNMQLLEKAGEEPEPPEPPDVTDEEATDDEEDMIDDNSSGEEPGDSVVPQNRLNGVHR